MKKSFLYSSIVFVIVNLVATSLYSAVTVLDPSQSRVDQPAPTPPNPILVDNAKRLLADNWVIEKMSGLKRTMHPVKKHPRNPIFKPEKPWEKPAMLLFGTVMYDPRRDEDQFRMWYLCFTPQYSADFSQRKNKNGRIAYAISRDGVHWNRPKLGIHDYGGSKENNIVITGAPDSTSIIYDPLDPDPQRRYKAHIRNTGRHLAYFSPDGIHWTNQGVINIDGNDRSTVHWDPLRRHWFATTKSSYKTARGDIRRCRGYQQSKDFLHWGPVSFMCATPEGAPDIVYNLEPFYYESLFLGLWGRYTAEPDALLDVQLAVSHNGRHWQRPSHDPWIPLTPLPKDFRREKKPYITPVTGVDPRDPRVPWDYGNNSCSALGPVRVGDQLWMYYSGRRTDHRSKPHIGAIGLGTLRLDGFFSLDAGKSEGTLLTRPMRLVHNKLHVNANVAGGQLRVEIVDPAGKPIPPFTRQNCVPVTTDSVRHQIQWKGAGDLSPVLGKTVRLRFTLKKTELYAFWTGLEHRWHTPDTTTWKKAGTIVSQATQPPVRKQPISEKPKTEKPKTDLSLFPKAYGLLANERLMFPVDMRDWPLKIDNSHQLFVDDYLIASTENLRRTVHQAEKYASNPIMKSQTPWEGGGPVHQIVRRDESTGRYRMWYAGLVSYNLTSGVRVRFPGLYAESKDGVHWERPKLGLHEFDGSKANNIVIPAGDIRGLIIEPNEPDPSRRYKAVVWHEPKYVPREGYFLYISPDGFHWKRVREEPLAISLLGYNMPQSGVGDTSIFRWDRQLGKYIGDVKFVLPGKMRCRGIMESDDLLHWTRPRMTLYPDSLDDSDSQIYGHLSFCYEGMWLGFLRVMHTERSMGYKQTTVELTASRDGRHWTRVGRREEILPLGVEDEWDSDYHDPSGDPILVDNKLWIYYRNGKLRRGEPRQYAIGLATLRRDGFVSLDGGQKAGVVTTRPLSFAGKRLFLNADVADSGSIRVALLSSKGELIENFALDDSNPIKKGSISIPVTWKTDSGILLPSGGHVRLQFELKQAKLYSFWID